VILKFPVLALAVFASASLTTAAAAADITVEELERKLEQRDKVIDELLQRVESLERRLDIDRGAATETISEAASRDDPAPEEVDDAGQAPGTVVVDEDAAERALERSLTQAGALLLRPGLIEVEPSLIYARQEDETPTFVSGGGTTFSGQLERNSNSLTSDLSLRLGLPWDSQLELGLPYRWRNVETVTNVGFAPVSRSSDTGAGVGDLRIGVAKTLVREGVWRPDLVGRLTWDTATGVKTDDGISLGGGFNELRVSLTAIKRQDPIAFVGSLSYQHVFEDGDVQPDATIAANVGGFIALSPETSLRLVLATAYQGETEVLGSDIDGSNRVIGSFVIGGSTLLGRGLLINLSAGIGLTDDADDFSISLSLPVRFDSPIY
jgi:hypothetical protein